jgi:hypothetical protein
MRPSSRMAIRYRGRAISARPERPPKTVGQQSCLPSPAGFTSGGRASKFGRTDRIGPVAAKYRNPDNPAKTWAGRGLKPRWLTAAVKGGKKLEDFAIAPGTATSKANGREKAGRATAKAKAAKADVCPICDFQTTLGGGIDGEGPDKSLVPPVPLRRLARLLPTCQLAFGGRPPPPLHPPLFALPS